MDEVSRTSAHLAGVPELTGHRGGPRRREERGTSLRASRGADLLARALADADTLDLPDSLRRPTGVYSARARIESHSVERRLPPDPGLIAVARGEA